MSWRRHFDNARQRGSHGDFEGAVKSFKRAIAKAPHEPYPHYELGYTLCQMGRIEEGVREFQMANELAEGFYMVQTELFIYESFLNGSIDERSVKICREILKLNDILQYFNECPHYWSGPSGLELIPQLDRLARELCERAPNFALSEFFFAKHALGESIKTIRASLKRCLSLDPDDTTTVYAMCYLSGTYAEEDPGKAMEIFKEVVEKFPTNPHASGYKFLIEKQSSEKALKYATRWFRRCGYERY